MKKPDNKQPVPERDDTYAKESRNEHRKVQEGTDNKAAEENIPDNKNPYDHQEEFAENAGKEQPPVPGEHYKGKFGNP